MTDAAHAMVVIDMQRAFVSGPGGSPGVPAALAARAAEWALGDEVVVAARADQVVVGPPA